MRAPAAALLAALLAGAAPAADPAAPPARGSLESIFGDTTLARGKGVQVTSSQLERAFIAFRATASSRGQRITEETRPRHEAQLLDRILVTQLLTNQARVADVTNAQARAAKYLDEATKTAGGETALQRQLLATGIRFQQFRDRAFEEALADVVLDREIRASITVTDAQVNEFYRTGSDLLVKLMEADLEKLAGDPSAKPAQVGALRERIDAVRKGNLDRLEQPERTRIIHLFQATRDRQANTELPEEQRRIKAQFMEKLRDRARAGEDFQKLVQEFSEDPNLAETKGEYTLTRNSPFSPEFKTAAFTLDAGRISDVVTTPYGLHLIKCLEKIPARKAEFEKVSGELRDFLTAQAVQRAMPGYFARLKKEAAVEILDETYRAILSGGNPGAPAP